MPPIFYAKAFKIKRTSLGKRERERKNKNIKRCCCMRQIWINSSKTIKQQNAKQYKAQNRIHVWCVHQLNGLPTHCKRWFIVLLREGEKKTRTAERKERRENGTNRVCKTTIPLIFTSHFFETGKQEREKKFNYILCCSMFNEWKWNFSNNQYNSKKHNDCAYNFVWRACQI